MGAEYDDPSVSSTPVTWPSRDVTAATGASSRISAPNDCAARASTCVNPPLPFLWNAQAPNTPSCSPMKWYSSTSPEPWERGPTFVPMIDDDAR